MTGGLAGVITGFVALGKYCKALSERNAIVGVLSEIQAGFNQPWKKIQENATSGKYTNIQAVKDLITKFDNYPADAAKPQDFVEVKKQLKALVAAHEYFNQPWGKIQENATSGKYTNIQAVKDLIAKFDKYSAGVAKPNDFEAVKNQLESLVAAHDHFGKSWNEIADQVGGYLSIFNEADEKAENSLRQQAQASVGQSAQPDLVKTKCQQLCNEQYIDLLAENMRTSGIGFQDVEALMWKLVMWPGEIPDINFKVKEAQMSLSNGFTGHLLRINMCGQQSAAKVQQFIFDTLTQCSSKLKDSPVIQTIYQKIYDFVILTVRATVSWDAGRYGDFLHGLLKLTGDGVKEYKERIEKLILEVENLAPKK